ncbi:hypothetical protein NUU61_008213 [Penicillium alfredii]|uniref:Aminotransferase class I/classII large domain-containing protein n=1 Tax=Penicillium alfredii TaxID=1506179 RepID=A0A9W9ES82_9EURO|nr:uncharacterized protein NUU61_008213 [Penicillium alfredii]KAJ5086906.1 hypothetical protein NUU61_008213 [Penicillium alfredii]
MLSSRGLQNVQELDLPWRFSPTQSYDAETNPTGLISFGMAENKPMRAEMAKYINEKVVFSQDSVSYRSSASTAARLPAAAAAHLNRILSPHASIEPEHVFVADSPTSLGNMLGFNLAERDEAILVNRPVYGRFELDYGVEAGIKIVYADTATEEAFSPGSVLKYEEALAAAESQGTKIRAVLLVNPHNPVGRCYPVKTLEEIARFCNKHRLHLISDEVYASCVFDSGDPNATPFTSILSLDLARLIDPSLVHVLYGFSKARLLLGRPTPRIPGNPEPAAPASVQGNSVRFIYFSLALIPGLYHSTHPKLSWLCRRLHGASQAAVTIGTAILEDEAFVKSFTAKSQQSLAAGYRHTTSTLNEAGINYINGGNAGFFIYIDLSPYLPNPGAPTREREFALAQNLVDAGVFLHPGEEHSKDAGWFRLVFSQEEAVLREGLRR